MQAATAAVMDIKMALAGAGGMDMSDCGGCADDDNGASACVDFCAAPVLAVTDPGKALQPAVQEAAAGLTARSIAARTGPPDLHPPRNIILI